MGKIITKNGLFSFEEIKNSILSLTTDYESDSVRFCHDWLNGKESFTLFTSGSTGIPKSITLSRKQMEASALCTTAALDLKTSDTALVCLNTKYIAGIMMLVRAMVVNMDIILLAPGSAPLREIPENVRPDFIALVPLQLETILEENNAKELAVLNSMKAIIIGGAAISSRLEAKLQQLSSAVFSTYGMTETVSHVALRRLNGKEKQDYYQALPGISLDTDDRGCLKIKADVTDQQWLQTNDLVELFDKTKFRWLGRTDTIINSGGVKIQPEKIEKLIEDVLSNNKIEHYFITGLPHPTLGEAVTLFIEQLETPDISMPEKIRPLLDKYEQPKAIIPMIYFPRTLTGKIDRKKIIELHKNYF